MKGVFAKNEWIGNKRRIWKVIIVIFLMIVLISSVLIIVRFSPNTSGQKFPDETPLQNTIKENIKNKKYSLTEAPEFKTEVLEKNETHVKLKGTTTIKFKNPKEAGYITNKWAKFQVEDSSKSNGQVPSLSPFLAEQGTTKTGDYDQKVKDYILLQIQNIEDENERARILAEWNNYDFESGTRTYNIEEVYEITYPAEAQQVSSYAMMSTGSTSITGNDILMGFTIAPPKIDWTIGTKIEILGFTIFEAKAGLYFDVGFGLRLPTKATLNVPRELLVGDTYTLSTSIEGVNWDAKKYSEANVPPEGGNEFLLHLIVFAGVKLTIAEIDVIDWYIESNINQDKDFKTPFGPDEEFPIPDLILSPDQTGIKKDWKIASIGAGLIINTDIGSKTIAAKWSVGGDATGNGTIKYHKPRVFYDFGPVLAGDYGHTDFANIQLSEFKYYFDKIQFDVDANVILGIPGIDVVNVPINIITIDARDITGGSYLGVHSGTTADTVDGSVFVNISAVILEKLREIELKKESLTKNTRAMKFINSNMFDEGVDTVEISIKNKGQILKKYYIVRAETRSDIPSIVDIVPNQTGVLWKFKPTIDQALDGLDLASNGLLIEQSEKSKIEVVAFLMKGLYMYYTVESENVPSLNELIKKSSCSKCKKALSWVGL